MEIMRFLLILILKTSYEAQYILTKLDKSRKPDNTTRAGLCPYCETIEFLDLKIPHMVII